MKHTTLLIALGLCTSNALSEQLTDWSTATHNPYFADVNGNEKIDLFLQAKSPDTNSLLVLDDITQSVVPIELANAKVTLGDVNGDGFADLFVVYPAEQIAATYFGNVDGLHSTAVHQYSVDSLTWLGNAAEIELLSGDFNGDGREDVVVVSDKKHYVMHADVGGQLSVVQTINGNAKWGSKRSENWLVRDFNGDGRDDIFAHAKQQNQQHTITYADENGFLTHKNSHKIDAKITGVDWHGDDYSIGAGNIDDDKAVELVRFNNSGGMIDENGVFTPGEFDSNRPHHSYAPGKKKASTTQSLVGVPVLPSSPNYPGNGGSSYKPYGITYSIPFASVSGATYYQLFESSTNSNYALKYSGSGTSASFIHYNTGYQYYRYKACNAAGCSGLSDALRIYVYTVPGTANNLTVSPLNVGTNVNYTVSWTPAGGAVDGAVYTLYENGSVVYSVTRATWQETSYSFTTSKSAGGAYRYDVNVCNPQVSCSSTVVTAYQTVIAPNSPPIANADSMTLNQGSTVYINVLGNDWDPEGQALTPSVFNTPSHGSTAIVNNHIRYTPYSNYYGTDSFTYWARDTQGAYSAVVQVYLTINVSMTAPYLSRAASPNMLDYTIQWSGVSGATRYELQEQINNGNWRIAHNGLVNSMIFTKPVIADYNYRVKACDAANQCSGWSSVLPAMRLKNTYTANDVLGTPILRSDKNTTVEKTKYSYPFGQQEDKQ